MIYLDTAATAPVRREALDAAWPYLTGTFGNPSSHHPVGEAAAAGLEEARARAAAVLGARRPGRSGESIVLDLAEQGVIASSGSACAAGSDEPSHVLLALGIPPEVAQTALRFTLGPRTSAAEVEGAATVIGEVLTRR
ncbi:aminotransferase class V-fold PLP-dependent enzyme [Brachybacterium vulturis]|uniref:aminotransferase class V-fold PLP-dependent enzyme n=1 Tax=Brachybacterium vulturis TaxID=2017484 RepID=UPI00373531F1